MKQKKINRKYIYVKTNIKFTTFFYFIIYNYYEEEVEYSKNIELPTINKLREI